MGFGYYKNISASDLDALVAYPQSTRECVATEELPSIQARLGYLLFAPPSDLPAL
jgi:hypothetical protein